MSARLQETSTLSGMNSYKRALRTDPPTASQGISLNSRTFQTIITSDQYLNAATLSVLRAVSHDAAFTAACSALQRLDDF